MPSRFMSGASRAAMLLALLAPLSACQNSYSTQSEPPDVSSDRFLNLDQELLQQREQTSADQQLDKLTPTLTDPVDITQDGTYQLQTATFPCSEYNPNDIGFVGPRDIQFYWDMSDLQLMPVENGTACRLELTATVTEVAAPYAGFRVWVS